MSHLSIHTLSWLRCIGSQWTKDHFMWIDLSADNMQALNIRKDGELNDYIYSVLTANKRIFAFGGYHEKRGFYQSDLFSNPNEQRDIHLGIDIWCEAHTPIYAPQSGLIHSFAYNDKELDYGYTLILQHNFGGHKIHSLYGHLSSSHINQWQIGMTIKEGELIGHIGPKYENGGWAPHLHLQLIFDMEGMLGDYPGVCSLDKLKHYSINCPNPLVLEMM